METDGEDWTPETVVALLANPFYAIDIDPELAVSHPKIISEDKWVRANAKMIAETGAEAWLRSLLDVLKGGYV